MVKEVTENDAIIFRKFHESDSLEELTSLLHRSYKQLADLDLKYVATYQAVDVTAKRIKDGICFVVESNNKIIGTATYYPPGKSFASQKSKMLDYAWIGQMGIEPEYQKQGIGTSLMQHIEQYAKENGAKKIGLDTAEHAEHLIELYEKLGYKFIDYIDWDVTNYRSVILEKEIS